MWEKNICVKLWPFIAFVEATNELLHIYICILLNFYDELFLFNVFRLISYLPDFITV